MKKEKFETDCKIPFRIDWLSRYRGCKYCGIKLENNYVISYAEIPEYIRYGFAPAIRYFKTDEGQEKIKQAYLKHTGGTL